MKPAVLGSYCQEVLEGPDLIPGSHRGEKYTAIRVDLKAFTASIGYTILLVENVWADVTRIYKVDVSPSRRFQHSIYSVKGQKQAISRLLAQLHRPV